MVASAQSYRDAVVLRRRKCASGGFTLIEIIVAVGLFSVVMLVSTGALLALVTANRKAQVTQSVMNNLNIALDGMVRNIREGTSFHCGSGTGLITQPADCATNVGPAGGDTLFGFRPFAPAHDVDRTIYYFQNGRIYQQQYINGAYQTAIAITASEVQIDTMRFYVTGTITGDQYQPRVVMVVKGTVGYPSSTAKVRSSFNIQATAVQRVLDL
jgi:prepilin-type N-terminal cleavage/methylation domain-containing protein